MKLSVSKTKNKTFYYALQSFRDGNKTSTYVAEKIGEHQELLNRGIADPLKYAKERVAILNDEFANNKTTISQKINFNDVLPSNDLVVSKKTSKNIGWLYLASIYNSLGIPQFMESIQGNMQNNLNHINRFLTIARILDPKSKKGSYDTLDKYFNIGEFSLPSIYRALTIIDEHSNEYQKILFEGTKALVDLNTSVLYYDCTNFYFEIEDQDDNDYDDEGNIIQWGLRRYGISKEHRPNPIVQMGLFTDYNGIPISYCINHGSNNEQNTLIPLEERMINDYKTSRFIYCSDGGLGSSDNRFYNTFNNRDYVVTQSLKKISKQELNLIFKDINWKFVDNDESISLNRFKQTLNKVANNEELSPEEEQLIKRDMIYKSYSIKRKINVANFIKQIKKNTTIEIEETIHITFSAKFYLYQKRIFDKQLNIAKEWLNKDVENIKKGPNDIRRFIKIEAQTENGEIAKNKFAKIDNDVIENETKFHGFYAIATSLESDIKSILHINSSRWKIEQSFRIMKTNFNSRPVFESTPEHIRAHFAICYTALLIYRILERKLYLLDKSHNHFSVDNIIETIKNLEIVDVNNVIYNSIYTNSKILTELEKIFNLRLNVPRFKKTTLIAKTK